MIHIILCGTAALSGLSWLGYKYFKKWKETKTDVVDHMEIVSILDDVRPLNKVPVPRRWQKKNNRWLPNEIEIASN